MSLLQSLSVFLVQAEAGAQVKDLSVNWAADEEMFGDVSLQVTCTRNQTMNGVKFLLRLTMRRHDLAAEIFHLGEQVNVPLTLAISEALEI